MTIQRNYAGELPAIQCSPLCKTYCQGRCARLEALTTDQELEQAAKRDQARHAARSLVIAALAALVATACTAPPRISAADRCYLHYTPMPVNPFSTSGDYRAPDNHCLLELPRDIAEGGTMTIDPGAFVP